MHAVEGATRLAIADEGPLTFGRGRVCAHDGCGTRLSTYNPLPVCALHGGNVLPFDPHEPRSLSRRARRLLAVLQGGAPGYVQPRHHGLTGGETQQRALAELRGCGYVIETVRHVGTRLVAAP
jgi:hypothetical protein